MSVKSITRNAFVYIVFEVINKALPFLLIILLTHYLSPVEMGVIAEFTATLGILSIIIGLNVHGAIAAAFFRINSKELSVYIYNVLLILVVTCGFVLIFSSLLTLLNLSIFSFSIGWLQIAIITSALTFITSINLVLWQSEMKPVPYGIYQTSLSFLNISLSLLFVLMLEMGWEGRILGQVMSVTFFGIVGIYILIKRNYIKCVINVNYLKDALRFGVPLIPHSLSSWGLMGFNIVLISSIVGKGDAGIFSISMQFVLILQVINDAINRTLQPLVYKFLVDANYERKLKYVKYIYFGMVVSIIIGVFSYFIIVALFDIFISNQFNESKYYLPYLVAAEICNGLYYFVVKPIYMINKTYRVAIGTFTSASVHVVLSLLLISHFGTIGVVYSLIFSKILIFFITWWQAQLVYPLPWFKFNEFK